ncbi:helix-turn-helix transcriptional regulator [Alcaligenaceae bacterium SJ-26]|nr:helix-turn-helix transcriptional regulator [Alcaligenaceae bacterium SJ-26]
MQRSQRFAKRYQLDVPYLKSRFSVLLSQVFLDPSCIGILYTQTMSIGKWIKEVRKSRNLTQTELGEKLGRTKANISAWENDAHEPSYSQVLSIANIVDWTIRPPGFPTLAPSSPRPDTLQKIISDAIDSANQEEYVPVRRASVKIVGGDPVITVDPAGGDFNGVINLSKTWLQKRGLKAESVFVATVVGDSMQPRIHEGDLLLLNQADTTKRDGRVYGFVHAGRFVVKRLRKDGRRWLLTSDNPEYAPMEAIEATKVVGRVVLMQGEGV